MIQQHGSQLVLLLRICRHFVVIWGMLKLLKPAGYFTYHLVLYSIILHRDYIALMPFVWLSEQTVIFVLYIINRLVFITEAESVYCAVRPESLYKTGTFRQ